MRRCWKACLGLTLLAVGGPAAHAQGLPGPPPIEEVGFRLYADGCSRHLGKLAQMQEYFRSRGLVPAPQNISTRILNNRPGEVWVIPVYPGIATVVEAQGARCSAYLYGGDQEKLNQHFMQVVESGKRPGLFLDKVRDHDIAASTGPVRLLSYRIGKEPRSAANADRLYTLMSTEAAGSMLKIVMSVSLVKGSDNPAPDVFGTR